MSITVRKLLTYSLNYAILLVSPGEVRMMDISTYFPIWNKLNESEQQALSANVRELHYHKGDLIHTGDDCMGLILVASGQLRAYTISDDGREITMYRLFERDICLFSASCMMRSIQFDIAISAEKDTDVILIPSDTYRNIMEHSATLANYTNEVMASRFSDVMWLIDQIMWKSFDKRLAHFLLSEANIEGSVILKITHEEIGNHMGSPREVVTRMLKYFVSEGAVKLSRGTVEIIDEGKLKDIINK